jgi:hypothetical protein
MTLYSLLEEINKIDNEVHSQSNTRRKALQRFGSFAKKTALATLPFSLASTFKRAHAQSPNIAAAEAVLQFALIIKYLKAEFYTTAISSVGLVPAGMDSDAMMLISNHETQHVTFLVTSIESLGKTPVAKPVFDFSGGKGTGPGIFAGVFTNFDTFLAVAQILEDTAVRAFKGQISELVGAGNAITDLLNIHSVDARHASHIRRMRMIRGASIKPWITGKESVIGAAAQLSYEGEELSTQGGISITEINGLPITLGAASESFDEPLTREQTLTIIDPFFV